METIHIKKSSSNLYFFQKGAKSDTIPNHSLFYFIVPDSLKKIISVYVDNGQLVTTANDSILQLNYIRNLKYECIFTGGEGPVGDPKHKKKNLEFRTLVNGPSSHPLNEISISIVNKAEDEELLRNTYYLKVMDKDSK